jgi:hypothetical protein
MRRATLAFASPLDQLFVRAVCITSSLLTRIAEHAARFVLARPAEKKCDTTQNRGVIWCASSGMSDCRCIRLTDDGANLVFAACVSRSGIPNDDVECTAP